MSLVERYLFSCSLSLCCFECEDRSFMAALSYVEKFVGLLVVASSLLGLLSSEEGSSFDDEIGLSVQFPPSRDNCFGCFQLAN